MPVVRRLSTVTGPAGVGKATLARAVLAGRNVAELDGPTVGALESGARLQRVTDAVTRLRHDRGVLLVTDLDALLPAEPEPVSTLILDELRRAVDTPGVAFVATTAHPDALDDRTRGQDVCDRELTIPLPDGATRRAVLELMLKRVPTDALDLTERERLVDEGVFQIDHRAAGVVDALLGSKPTICTNRHRPTGAPDRKSVV